LPQGKRQELEKQTRKENIAESPIHGEMGRRIGGQGKRERMEKNGPENLDRKIKEGTSWVGKSGENCKKKVRA